MIQSPHDKATLTQMTDQAFRARLPHRAADQLIHILDVQGVPRFFSPLDRTLLKGFQSFGGYLPGVAMPLVKEKMHKRRPTSSCLPSRNCCAPHLRRAPRRGRADERQLSRRGALGRGGSRAAAGKLSCGAAAARDRSPLGEDLDDLFADFGAGPASNGRRALRPLGTPLPRRSEVRNSSGTMARACPSSSISTWKSIATWRSRPRCSCGRSIGRGSNKSQAGIALQAYIPDSFAVQQEITAWARERVATGRRTGHDPHRQRGQHGDGTGRGERCKAGRRRRFNTRSRPTPTTTGCSQFGMRAENLAAVRLGIASHNLFTWLMDWCSPPRAVHSTACSSKCSKGWPTTSGGHCSNWHETCCSTPRPADRKISSTPSATWSAGWMKTRAPKISCGTPSGSRVDSPDWQQLAAGFAAIVSTDSSAADAATAHAGSHEADVQIAREPDIPLTTPALEFQLFTTNPTPIGRCRKTAHGPRRSSSVGNGKCDDAGHRRATGRRRGRSDRSDRERRDSLDPSRPGVVVARYHAGQR